MSWQNTNVPIKESSSYPFIQWINYGNALDPKAPKGGFGMAEEQMGLADNYPLGAEMRGFALNNGEIIPVAFTHRVHAAVLATRFAWVKEGNFIPNYVPGARSKLQALAIFIGQEKQPFLARMTFTGMAGKSFSDALREHGKRIRTLSRQAGQEASPKIFYATFDADNPQMAGTKNARSLYTPVVLYTPESYDLSRAFVGNDTLTALVNWDEVQVWREAWQNISGPNGDGVIEEEDEHVTPRPQSAATPKQATAAPVPAALVTLLRATMQQKGFPDVAINATLNGITNQGAQELLKTLGVG